MTSKLCCVTCGKGIGQFKCEGCSQTFCTKHVVEHRQTLNQQLEDIILEHDTLQQATKENKRQSTSLMTYIDQWEQKSIEKIRQMAKEVREKVSQFADVQKSKLRKLCYLISECITYRTSRVKNPHSTNKNSTPR
jgi:adenylosuccinate synthase